MNKRNSILDTLSEGMLTTIKTNKGGIFAEISKGKIDTKFNRVVTGNMIYDTVAEIVLRRREISSRVVDNKTFCDYGDGYILVVFHKLTIARAILLKTDFNSRHLENTISKVSLLPKDYQSFTDKVDRVFRVSANVMYDTDSRRACLNVGHCIRTFFRKWFKLNTTTDFRKYLVNDTRLISCIKVDSVSIGDSNGMDWVLSFGFDVVDREQFDEINSYLSGKVDNMSCYDDIGGKGVIDFYII
jgi:hypothetical protein